MRQNGRNHKKRISHCLYSLDLLHAVFIGSLCFVKLARTSTEFVKAMAGTPCFYLWTWLLGIVTLGIYPLVWFYKAMDRLCDNGYRYAVRVKHSGGDFLLWTLLGSFIAVGPIVAYCYFVADINQFEPFVGYVEPKPYRRIHWCVHSMRRNR